MKKNINSEKNISITNDEIATMAGIAASECYGVVGMASKNTLREGIAELLKKENYNRGVFIKKSKQGIVVDMYIIVAYGVKISEVVSEVQKKVNFVLKKECDINFDLINVFVQDVKS